MDIVTTSTTLPLANMMVETVVVPMSKLTFAPNVNAWILHLLLPLNLVMMTMSTAHIGLEKGTANTAMLNTCLLLARNLVTYVKQDTCIIFKKRIDYLFQPHTPIITISKSNHNFHCCSSNSPEIRKRLFKKYVSLSLSTFFCEFYLYFSGELILNRVH